MSAGKSRTQTLLDHLERWSGAAVRDWSSAYRSTPYLSVRLGIRNVPDAVMKLRRRGFAIRTERRAVMVEGIQYPDVAVYTYIKPEPRYTK